MGPNMKIPSLTSVNIKGIKAAQVLFILLSLLIAIVGLVSESSGAEPNTSKKDDTGGVETLIPPNHVLVPIQLVNAESFAALVGGFTVVDLFLTNSESSKGKRIISSAKLLRAPLNPDQFAILITEEELVELPDVTSPLFAVIKNPNSKKSQKKNQGRVKPIPKLSVEYQQ
jgi:hypothetical protein